MTSSANPHEIARFAELSDTWWDVSGPLKTLHDINPTRLAFVEKYLKLAESRILDVGCGGGILAEAMARRRATVTGIDAEQGAIEAARAHAKTAGLSVSYHCALLEAFEEDGFDAITCMEMLEHVDEPQAVVTACAARVTSGGYVFLSTINRTARAWLTAVVGAEYVLRLLPRQTHDFQKFITPGELAAMARAAGLDPVSQSGMSYNPFTREAQLCRDVSVNYLLACRKP